MTLIETWWIPVTFTNFHPRQPRLPPCLGKATGATDQTVAAAPTSGDQRQPGTGIAVSGQPSGAHRPASTHVHHGRSKHTRSPPRNLSGRTAQQVRGQSTAPNDGDTCRRRLEVLPVEDRRLCAFSLTGGTARRVSFCSSSPLRSRLRRWLAEATGCYACQIAVDARCIGESIGCRLDY